MSIRNIRDCEKIDAEVNLSSGLRVVQSYAERVNPLKKSKDAIALADPQDRSTLQALYPPHLWNTKAKKNTPLAHSLTRTIICDYRITAYMVFRSLNAGPVAFSPFLFSFLSRLTQHPRTAYFCNLSVSFFCFFFLFTRRRPRAEW